MSGAYFFIERFDGTVTQIKFKTAKMAAKAHDLYSRNPEDTAKRWGWDTITNPPTMAQQLRAKKIAPKA